ncbi:capsular biosynthesis protein CpsC [Gemella sp. GH3]|uniref:Wzz/FepE/Etk N-terminal domain-containing protein n=1 Tax=unclassified Gemella TaxID=2624949 RepID=UPI0015CFC1A9|nr:MULTISPECIES: Wzz/FepE/Etk N-terminal domain-containing protein [unclassified Gemella]MBF0713331.1 capsular biosynthesis protein CpsC [Gemella sp. GH3.1]NYS50283.1 capsular biosynthesis protein CpsC [Gemella sp. GH3]
MINNGIEEIDLTFLIKKIWNKKIIIVATSLFFAAIMVSYNIFITKPTYKSTTKIYAVNQNEKEKTLTVQDIQIGTNLVKDYQQIILSSDVLEETITKNNLNISQKSLANKIEITAPKDTRVVEIIVEDKDANKASDIANSLRESSIKKIKSITKINEITTIEEAKPSNVPASPNVKRNGVIAFIFGLVLSISIIVIREILDDKVKRPEDIEDVLDMILLGVIPKQEKGKNND